MSRYSLLLIGFCGVCVLSACNSKDDDEGDTPQCFLDADCSSNETNIYGDCVPYGTLEIGGGSVAMGEHGQNVEAVDDFQLDTYLVTNDMYLDCVMCEVCTPPAHDSSYSGREPYFGSTEFGNYPVIYITWEQAREFCQGRDMDLPSEAQWEMAARGVEGRIYPWGNFGPSVSYANFGYYAGDTTAVGARPDGATPQGVLDMAGNVWEWVLDGYDENYAPAADTQNKVLRGASFGAAIEDLAAYVREAEHKDAFASTIGFRCAK